MQQGSPTYGPRAKCSPFQKNNGPFSILRSKKKVIKKFWDKWQKIWVDGPQQKRLVIFPFFGPPATKGWRPLLYNAYCVELLFILCIVYNEQYTLYSVQYTLYCTYTLKCILYNLQSTRSMYNVQFTLSPSLTTGNPNEVYFSPTP